MEDLLAHDRREHLASCQECRRQVDDLASVLSDAKQASIPEPSPLFWQNFSTRVNTSIDQAPASGWPQWLRWQVLLPLGAMAMIILMLTMALPKQNRDEVVAVNDPVVIEPAADDNWGTVVALVGELDLDTAAAAGVIEPGIADQAVLHLTAEEQQALSRLLQAELSRAKS
jgi:hypothetical protein